MSHAERIAQVKALDDDLQRHMRAAVERVQCERTAEFRAGRLVQALRREMTAAGYAPPRAALEHWLANPPGEETAMPETRSKPTGPSDESIQGTNDRAFEAACRAFRLGPPGVLRRVQQVDSYPGEPDDRSDAYQPLPTTNRDERKALADAINAYLDAAEDPPR